MEIEGTVVELVLMAATLDSVVTGAGDEMAAGGSPVGDSTEDAAPDGEAVTVTVSLAVTVTVTAGGQEALPAPAPELPALTFVGNTIMVVVVVEVVEMVVVEEVDGEVVDTGLTALEEARQMVVVTTMVEVPVPRV
jgi:hypothetical protein